MSVTHTAVDDHLSPPSGRSVTLFCSSWIEASPPSNLVKDVDRKSVGNVTSTRAPMRASRKRSRRLGQSQAPVRYIRPTIASQSSVMEPLSARGTGGKRNKGISLRRTGRRQYSVLRMERVVYILPPTLFKPFLISFPTWFGSVT